MLISVGNKISIKLPTGRAVGNLPTKETFVISLIPFGLDET